jgi:hypothetical protein
MAFAGYFVQNATNWPTTHPDFIGVLSDDISQSQKNRFGQQPVELSVNLKDRTCQNRDMRSFKVVSHVISGGDLRRVIMSEE